VGFFLLSVDFFIFVFFVFYFFFRVRLREQARCRGENLRRENGTRRGDGLGKAGKSSQETAACAGLPLHFQRRRASGAAWKRFGTLTQIVRMWPEPGGPSLDHRSSEAATPPARW